MTAQQTMVHSFITLFTQNTAILSTITLKMYLSQTKKTATQCWTLYALDFCNYQIKPK